MNKKERFNFTMIFILFVKFIKPFILIFEELMVVFIKLIKGVSGIKLGLAAGTFGVYTVLVDWRFSLCLMFCIGIHEAGHVWAMKKEKMKTKGFYFIPFFGGVAVPESAFPTLWSEGFVGIMGPMWGLGTTIVALFFYWLTENKVFEVAACFMAFVNLINLIPLFPLDGGRIIRALIKSTTENKTLSLIMSLLAIGFCAAKGYWIFVVLGASGILEEIEETRSKKKKLSESEAAHQKFERECREKFLEKIRPLSELPERKQGRELLEDVIFSLMRNPVFEDDIKTLGRLRKEFELWKSEFFKIQKSIKIGESHISSIVALSSLLEGKTDMQKDSTLKFSGKNVEQSFQDLKQSLQKLQEIYSQMNKVRPRVEKNMKSLLREKGIQSKNLEVFYRIYISIPEKYQKKGEEIKKNALFLDGDFFMKESAEIFWCLIEEMGLELGHPLRINKNFLWLEDIGKTLLILASDADAFYPFARQCNECLGLETVMDSKKWKILAIWYTALIMTLFLLMEYTGGSEVASHVVEFFKKF